MSCISRRNLRRPERRKATHIPPLPGDRATGDREKLGHRHARCGLSATRFTDDAQGFPLGQLKADPINGIHISNGPGEDSPLDGKVNIQILDGNQWLVHDGGSSTCNQQRTLCPLEISVNSGSRSRQTVMTWLQRSQNLQPSGSATRLGTMPLISFRRFVSPAVRLPRMGIEFSRPIVYGMQRLPEQIRRSTPLRPPGRHTSPRCGPPSRQSPPDRG
jgi:hypothetical protein